MTCGKISMPIREQRCLKVFEVLLQNEVEMKEKGEEERGIERFNSKFQKVK